jgi:hypothetical protein
MIRSRVNFKLLALVGVFVLLIWSIINIEESSMIVAEIVTNVIRFVYNVISKITLNI